jgi:hypothetical protein
LLVRNTAICPARVLKRRPGQVFKIILARVFDLKCNIPKIVQVGEPILEY